MRRCNNCFNLIEDSYVFCPECGYKEGNPPKEVYYLTPGMMLADRYIIGGAIGFGGFGITYKAYDSKLDTVIAVKEFYPSGIVNRNPGTKEIVVYAKKREREFYFFKERFLDEARNMAKFSAEQNIVNVFEFFEENNTAYIAMEFLDGQGLNKYLHNNNDMVPVDFGLKIADNVANALDKLHQIGIIHRDISPDNIFLCDNGNIKLIDFGAARFTRDENKQLTVILKPGFAPPEQYEQINKQGPWTDIYALGATLYYILTGQIPEESTNRKINDTLVYPDKINPEIPEYLSNTIMKAMAIDIDMRFKSISEFLEGLHQKKVIMTVDAEKKKRRNRRNAGILAAAAVVAVGLSTAFGIINSISSRYNIEGEITMWYCKETDAPDVFFEDEDAKANYLKNINDAELAGYNDVIADFQTYFPDVDVKIVGYDKDEYIEKLKSGSEQPNIYEYVDVDSSGQHLSLKEVYDSEQAKQCSLLGQANNYFGSYDYLPLGFTTPIVYGRKDDDNINGKSISDIKDITTGEGIAVDDKDFSKSVPGAKSDVDDSAFDKFHDKTKDFYGSDSNSFRRMMTAMPAQYTIIPFDSSEIYCEYSNIWAVNDIDEDHNKAALRFLEFMLNDPSQRKMFINNVNESFPINDLTLADFVDTYDEFGGFFDHKDNYRFER